MDQRPIGPGWQERGHGGSPTHILLDARNTRQFPATGRVEGPTDCLTYTTTSVFLGGKVGSRAEKLLAEKLNPSVEGVRKVVNNLSAPEEQR